MFCDGSGSQVKRQIDLNWVALYSQVILQNIDTNYEEIWWHLMTYEGKTYKTTFKTEAFLTKYWVILMIFKQENTCMAY